jgi:hypothetical protein
MTQRQFTLLRYVADAAEPSVNEPEAAVKVPPQVFLVVWSIERRSTECGIERRFLAGNMCWITARRSTGNRPPPLISTAAAYGATSRKSPRFITLAASKDGHLNDLNDTVLFNAFTLSKTSDDK